MYIRPDTQLQRSFPDDFFAFISQNVEKCLIAVDIVAVVQAVDIDGVDAGLEGGAVAFLALPQSLGSLLDLRDLFSEDKPARDPINLN